MDKKIAEVLRIITPQRFMLDGLWFGPSRARTVFIFVHGLGGTLFGMHKLLLPLQGRETAVLFFNNRGHDSASQLRREANNRKGYEKKDAGRAQEVFVECVDDIEGAVKEAEKRGGKRIYLVGHSTGSQKVAYYLSQKNKRKNISGGVLLSPISDFAGITNEIPQAKLKRVVKEVEKIYRKDPHALLPSKLWPRLIDAQRFLSLYSGKGPEEIFTYWDRKVFPRTLSKIRHPLFIGLAGSDEHNDRPVEDISNWFAEHLKDGDAIAVVKGANHGFHKKESNLIAEIKKWTILSTGR